MLKKLQEENSKLKSFMEEHLATSDKVKALACENQELKVVQARLEGQLNDMKGRVLISNGDELSVRNTPPLIFKHRHLISIVIWCRDSKMLSRIVSQA